MSLDRFTNAPPAGAAALNVTVPVETLPPVNVAGLRVTDNNGDGTGVTVNCAVCVTPKFPEMVIGVELATAVVVIVNVALV